MDIKNAKLGMEVTVNSESEYYEEWMDEQNITIHGLVYMTGVKIVNVWLMDSEGEITDGWRLDELDVVV